MWQPSIDARVYSISWTRGLICFVNSRRAVIVHCTYASGMTDVLRSSRLAFHAALIIAVFVRAPLAQESISDPQQGLSGAVQALFTRDFEAGKRHGCAIVGVVDHAATWHRAFGTLAKDVDRVPDLDTVFEIGSLTKLFTATLLALDVESGRFALDEPVAALLGADWSVAQQGERRVTVLDLATHTAGFPRLPRNMAPRKPVDPYADYDEARLRDAVAELAFSSPIGERYDYSNLGYGLLGFALAKASKASWQARIERDIAVPLELEATGYPHPESAGDKAREDRVVAPPHSLNGMRGPRWHFDTLAGAGALRSTLGDMLRFARAQVTPPKTALGQAILATQVARRKVRDGVHIGLGWHILDKKFEGSSASEPVLYHSGMTGGFASEILVVPQRKLAVVILANQARGASAEALRILELLVGRQAEAQRPAAQRPAATKEGEKSGAGKRP